ncbi:MAG: serine/threonine protein kinase [Myxococcales bacterium]|nr:serine/threonine protein kinase [Myxococcales bacterium]
MIGSGAMGTVVAAHHLLLDQKVAIKFLLPEALGHSEAVSRFLREARAAVRLKGEHVVRVLDVALLERGVPYIVMEHLEGCDLSVWLGRRRVLPVAQAVDFVLQACQGIAEAHALGIVHRDLKPANLFVVQRAGLVPSIKVLDFGVSKMPDPISTVRPTAEPDPVPPVADDTTVGSPVYMSPEQMECARDVDSRTDIWSLGVTLYELVTGRLPFEGANLMQVYTRIVSGVALRLRDEHPEVPEGLAAVIIKCLQRDPERRYRSVIELALALSVFGSNDAVASVGRFVRARRSTATPRASADAEGAACPRPGESAIADKTLLSGRLALSTTTRRRLAAGVNEPRRLLLLGLLGLLAFGSLSLLYLAFRPAGTGTT